MKLTEHIFRENIRKQIHKIIKESDDDIAAWFVEGGSAGLAALSGNDRDAINENAEVIDNYTFKTESRGYHHGQSDLTIVMYDKNIAIAKADYSIYQQKIHIQHIEALKRGKGYGIKLMQYLAKEYGYENLERSSLTPDGAKMRSKLDKIYNFDYLEHINKHFKPTVISDIGKKHPEVAMFLNDMCNMGYEDTWKNWLENNRISKKYDWNDISEIAEWIRGSKTNNHSIEEEPPGYVKDFVNQLIN